MIQTVRQYQGYKFTARTCDCIFEKLISEIFKNIGLRGPKNLHSYVFCIDFQYDGVRFSVETGLHHCQTTQCGKRYAMVNPPPADPELHHVHLLKKKNFTMFMSIDGPNQTAPPLFLCFGRRTVDINLRSAPIQ